jgi:serine/threonine protein kinase
MLHLDIRPANILLADGRAKLADFGLARPDSDAGMGSVYSPHVAPEVIATMKGSAHADQFSMAMTLGHLLSAGEFCAGTVPHPSDTTAWKKRPDLSTLDLHVPVRLRSVLAKATSVDPDDRYESVEEFKRQIDRATPATAFTRGDGSSLLSTDGKIAITRIMKRTGCTIEVLINGRRRTADGRTGLTNEEADKHIRSLVTQYSYST